MKKILIPVNFNNNSHDAIDYAIKFFKHEDCHFYFFNTYTYNVDGLNAIHLLQADMDWFEKPKLESENNLGAVIYKYTFNNRNKKHRFNAISESINLIDGIKKAIDEIKIDLVVIPGKKLKDDTIQGYSRNTRRIIENIRECPVMIIPSSAKLHKRPEFVLVSNFEIELPKEELQNWFELVKIVNGRIKIVTLFSKSKMTDIQKIHQDLVRFNLEIMSASSIPIENIDTVNDLKDFANYHSDYIICLMDRKPDIWRICGITQSRITNMGPLRSTPLIALHH
ncbi:hypothetical protein ULMA_28180 [Patiriisocius marinus]|uniref:UspA domain-containing protein n=1 Tax=Patiriisocius marinus TaxID=1397112 RepID=A0A5J4J4A0_9FLAO|nr:universal stress protein [Patiriisocius marinus]GER60710.1 hypothetical protein ULMA_28180 [Patiriisocius marinus]